MNLEKTSGPMLPEVYRAGVIDRALIRAIVEQDAQETADALTAGLNVHQLALDHSDKYEKLMRSVDQDDTVKFLTIYHEEQDAINQATLDRMRARTHSSPIPAAPAEESNFAKWIGLVTAIFMLYLLINLLKI